MTNQNIKKLVTAALLAAMTCVATMIIKIPTPTFGYIHPGDGFVLLCGVVLGPLPGALAAGIGNFLHTAAHAHAHAVFLQLLRRQLGKLRLKGGEQARPSLDERDILA